MKGDPLAKRATHWSRWRRHQVRDLWRHQVHVDLNADEARAAWLCSWQRSGSTLLAEVLSSAPGTRLVYEPANVPGALFDGRAAAAIPLPRGPGPELDAVERALRGRVHGTWVDQLAAGHVFHRRVVKDVRALGLLELVAARHPTTPIVVLVRHPLSVARSVVELGWSADDVDPRGQLVAEVRRWTELHASVLRAPVTNQALVVTYEHLVVQPDDVLDRVVAHLSSHHQTWRDLRIERERLQRPSATSFRRSDVTGADEWIGTFDDVDPQVRNDVADLLASSGLDALYGASPEPLVGPADVASALRRH